MCVACGQFTGSSSSKTQRMGRPAFFQEEKFLNWTGTMTLGSINNPHLLVWSLVLHQRKDTWDGERPVWGACRTGAAQRAGSSPPLYRAGKQPFKHVHTGKGKLECKKILITPYTNLLLGWAVPSSQTHLLAMCIIKIKLSMACLKCHLQIYLFKWLERPNFIHGKKWAELITEYWQMTDNNDNKNKIP